MQSILKLPGKLRLLLLEGDELVGERCRRNTWVGEPGCDLGRVAHRIETRERQLTCSRVLSGGGCGAHGGWPRASRLLLELGLSCRVQTKV